MDAFSFLQVEINSLLGMCTLIKHPSTVAKMLLLGGV